MKSLKFISSAVTFIICFVTTFTGFSQNKNLLDKPFIEVSGQADTLVMPNKIWINIFLSERDFKGRKSIEDTEMEMINKLKEIGIDTEKNITINDMTSNFKNYFLKQTDIFKTKSYSVIVVDAKTTSRVFIALETIGISNVHIEKIENSEEKKIQLLINGKAAENAKQIAESYSKPLNQKIGNAIQITNMNIPNQMYGQIRGISALQEVVVTAYRANKSSNYEPDIQFEKIKISSTAQIKFALE
ncbi:hypothetical protein EV144_10347 [Flavobacterium sp. 270]|uniref:SIMPL domain-containing protein n=1 Tax=Flavobacterium sp. 270 TaxID=2512114 RepID=UPI001064F086|nr:SIMPL domain-containing protein [Flavobacterium sp. 270]TDW48539.1 hypothetical protein EV144_10347 [Flavobacterium sp. 270]